VGAAVTLEAGSDSIWGDDLSFENIQEEMDHVLASLAPIPASGISTLSISDTQPFGYYHYKKVELPDMRPFTGLTHLSCKVVLGHRKWPPAALWDSGGQLRALRHLHLKLEQEEDSVHETSMTGGQAAQPLGQLEGLTQLQLEVLHGPISGLEELLPVLGRLQHLELTCSMQQVPRGLAALAPTLTCLVLSSTASRTQASLDWQPVGALQHLRTLKLSKWSLAEVPQPLSALSMLTYLQLDCNDFTGGWQHLLPAASGLQRLDLILSIEAAQPASFPQLLSAARSLAHVQLESVRSGEPGSVQLLHLLPQLPSLHLDGMAWDKLPEALAACSSLTALHIGTQPCLVDVGWQHLGALHQVRRVSCGRVACMQAPLVSIAQGVKKEKRMNLQHCMCNKLARGR